MEEKAREKALLMLQEVVNRLAEDGVKAASMVGIGQPAEQIIAVAETESCDLIAMSTHRRGSLGRAFLGSVTDKVVHASGVPTLTIAPGLAETYDGSAHPFSAVLVTLDGSDLAEEALPYVENLAKDLSLKVVLARVVEMGPFFATYSPVAPYGSSHELWEEAEAEAKEYLEEVAGRLRAKGLEVESKQLLGHPARSIAELADQTPRSIIAMTTHGRTGLTRWFLGSVSEALVRSSGRPLLVLPPAR